MDLIIHGGSIFWTEADALAVQCGKILAIGKSSDILPLAGPETKLIPLSGQLVVPGFFDAHVHFLKIGLDRIFFVDLAKAQSLSEALEMLRAAAEAKPGEWVVGRGWDESRWPEKRYLERADLDQVVARQPCCAVRVDGHMVVANTLALARCIRPEGQFVDRERGHFWEDAVAEVLSLVRPEQETLVEAVAEASRLAASLGITAVTDMSDPQDLSVYQLAERRGLLKTRIFAFLPAESLPNLAALGIRRGLGSPFLRLSGIKEVFVDGSIGAKTAALFEPYRAEMGRGRVLIGRAELARLWRKAVSAELPLAVHAIGDRAIEEALAAASLCGVSFHDRHRIEHLELPLPSQLDRMQKLGLIASMQPNFLQWSGPGKMYEDRLGSARDYRINPHRWILDRGIPLAFGSDGMPMGPLYGIGLALNPPHPSQKVSLEEALSAYTFGSAYAVFAENELGDLSPGKWADFLVLSGDPRKTSWEEITVEATFVAGEIVFSR